MAASEYVGLGETNKTKVFNAKIPKTTKWRRTRERDVASSERNLDEQDSIAEPDEELQPCSDPSFTVGNESHDLTDDCDNQVSDDNDNNLNRFVQFQEGCGNQDESGDELYQSEADQEPVDEPLYENAPVTLGQCLLLIMSFVLGNNLTSVAVGNLLKLLSMILPIGSRLPRTKYLFDKYLMVFEKDLNINFIALIAKHFFKQVKS
ncbi:uncharacterized protein LOC114544641 [Dendronephthya gigantea]|uniref:uncharacterized protein LOC114544641 n=1 Tax=Dendronephthya gigantea TaxID=151771 RepID=UPI00106A7EDE|nr:uncharacterized protein LOC114544641 [Dendronephthya gigantea]